MTRPIANNSISVFVLLMKVSIALMFCLTAVVNVTAHPGSGIVIDKEGNIYFTDTGKGVWKIDTKGQDRNAENSSHEYSLRVTYETCWKNIQLKYLR